ncbi:MAG TPA: hypothetical protein VK932_14330 [Kofleriaceae bacterium]|nr:hypothetical protein [Kofleriaceae bacterium]
MTQTFRSRSQIAVQIALVNVADKGSAHVHGAVNDHVNVERQRQRPGRRRTSRSTSNVKVDVNVQVGGVLGQTLR